MQDIIFKVMAVAIVLGGCVWGWWTENGPDKKDKKEAMEFKNAEKKTAFFEDGLENVLETGGNENEEN